MITYAGWLLLYVLSQAPENQLDAQKPATPTKKNESQTQKTLNKTREESLLVRNKLLPEASDLRSDFELYRDSVLVKHYTRLATLDAISEQAKRSQEDSLLDYAEEVRRSENRWFRTVMMQYRRDVQRQSMQTQPPQAVGKVDTIYAQQSALLKEKNQLGDPWRILRDMDREIVIAQVSR